MSTYQILDAETVIDTIIADAAFMAEHYPFGNYILLPEPTAPEAFNAWWIYVGAFYDRFNGYKLPILSSADPVTQAIIKDTSVRKYIDLQRPDVASALDYLISAGFEIDKTAILTTPVAEADRYAP